MIECIMPSYCISKDTIYMHVYYMCLWNTVLYNKNINTNLTVYEFTSVCIFVEFNFFTLYKK